MFRIPFLAVARAFGAVAAWLLLAQSVQAKTDLLRIGFLTVHSGALAVPVYTRDSPPAKNLEP